MGGAEEAQPAAIGKLVEKHPFLRVIVFRENEERLPTS